MGRLSTTAVQTGGRLGGTTGGGRVGGFDTSTAQGLMQYAQAKGLDVEEPKLSLLSRIGRTLTSFETGNSLYQSRYEGKSFAKTYASDIYAGLKAGITGHETQLTPKKTFKDILTKEGMIDRPGKLDAVDVVGLAGDILTDPTTWFGGAVLGKAVKGIKPLAQVIKKIPVIGKTLKTATTEVENLFKPFAEIERLGKKGVQYADNFKKYAKGTRAEVDDFLNELSKTARETEKAVPKAGVKIGEAIETATQTGDKFLDEIAEGLSGTQAKLAQQLKDRGILQSELPDYMHHMITPEARDYLKAGGDLTQFYKPIRVRLGEAKMRKIEGIVGEINKEYSKKLGFNLFEEDAFKAFSKSGVDSIKAVRTYDFLKRTGEQFGMKAEKDFVDNFGVKWIETGAKELKGVRVPEAIAKHIDETYKFLSNDESTKGFLRLYDNLQNFWKSTVTGYFPAFHTRNAIGGVFNNWIAGLKNPLTYKTANDILAGKNGEIITKTGKLSFAEIRTMLKEYGITGQTGILDVREVLERKIDPRLIDKVQRVPQMIMEKTESRLRTPLFIDGLQKGMTAEEAAKRVIKFHFDYMPEGFTSFEKNVMKRVIPFYTWTRHNIPLQIEQMIMQPGKYAGIFKTQRAFGIQPSSEEEQILPRWLREGFTIKGEGGYWSGIGLPLEEATQKLSAPLRGFGISMSPLLRVPMEQLTGWNIFKDKQIDEDTYGKAYKNAPQPLKNWLELKENRSAAGKVYYTLNPRKRYWLEVVLARGLNTSLKLADAVDDRNNLLSLITTIRKYNYSLDELKNWSDSDKRKELENELERKGLLKELSGSYIPK